MMSCSFRAHLVQGQHHSKVKDQAHQDEHYKLVDEVSIFEGAAIDFKRQFPKACAPKNSTNQGCYEILQATPLLCKSGTL